MRNGRSSAGWAGCDLTLRDAATALIIVTLWGLHTVIIRIGVLEVPPLLLLTLRMAGTALIFAPFARRIGRAQLKNIAIYSFFYIFLHIGLLAVGLSLLDSATTALILQATTPFAMIFGWLLHRESFGVKTLAGLILAFAGVCMILWHPSNDFSYAGAFLVLFSALCWGFGTVFARKTMDTDSASLLAWSHTIPLPFFLLLSLWFEGSRYPALIHEADPWIVLGVWAYQVLIVSFCHAEWRNLIVRNPVYLVASFSLIQPLMTVIFASLMLGETLSPIAMLGGAISLCGVGIVTMRKIQKEAPAAP